MLLELKVESEGTYRTERMVGVRVDLRQLAPGTNEILRARNHRPPEVALIYL